MFGSLWQTLGGRVSKRASVAITTCCHTAIKLDVSDQTAASWDQEEFKVKLFMSTSFLG